MQEEAAQGWHTVRMLAFTSLLADVSGEMVMAVLPLLLAAQGAGGMAMALVGGVSEAVGHAMKLAGGWLGDRVAHPRLLVLLGYLMAAASRFGVAAAPHPVATGAFRSLDRVGKGLRTAPRDVMLASSVPPAERGRAFGFNRAADTLGAVLGIVAALLLASSHTPSETIFIAAFVGLAAVAPLLFVRDPVVLPARGGAFEPMTPLYRRYLAVTGLFAMGQVSYLLFMARTMGAGLDVIQAILWYLAFNVVYTFAAYPAGVLADRWGASRVLVGGFLLSALASAAFIPQPGPALLVAAAVALGIAYAATQGLGRAVAAGIPGSAGASTRMGWYHAVNGLGTLAGAAAAGLLWDFAGPAWAFVWGTALALAGAAALLAWRRLERAAAAPPAATAS